MHRVDRLQVLHRIDRLVLDVYRLSAEFPSSERFALALQVRRAAVSIGSNIVEGAAYGTNKTFTRHLRIARGSLAEVGYQMRLASKLGYVAGPESESLDGECQHIRRMITGLIERLATEHANRPPT